MARVGLRYSEDAIGGTELSHSPPESAEQCVRLCASDPRLGWRVLGRCGSWALCESEESGRFYFHEEEQRIQADLPGNGNLVFDTTIGTNENATTPELTGPAGRRPRRQRGGEGEGEGGGNALGDAGGGGTRHYHDEPEMAGGFLPEDPQAEFRRIVLDDADMAAVMARDIQQACLEDPSLFGTVQARFSATGAEGGLSLSQLPSELKQDAQNLRERQLSECLPTQDGKFWILWRLAAAAGS